MMIRYDQEADAMYIQFREGKSFRTEETDDGYAVDYSRAGKVIGIEILFASKVLKNGLQILL